MSPQPTVEMVTISFSYFAGILMEINSIYMHSELYVLGGLSWHYMAV